MDHKTIKITLTKAEALVLFEFLSRFSDTDKFFIEDRSEKIALWGLTNLLEKNLVEPFRKDYDLQLVQARKELNDLIKE